MLRSFPAPSSAIALAITLALATSATTHAQSAPASGQNIATNLRVSTLGVGVEVSKLMTSRLAVRAAANMFSYDRSQDMSDVSYDATLDFKTFGALVDFFPGANGSFHLTGGLYKNNNKVSAVAVPNSDGTIEIDGTEYTSAEVGSLTGRVTFPSVTPYAGLGWGSPVRKGSRIRLAFDLGVVVGTPTVKLSATGAASDPSLEADLKEQEAKTQKDMDKYVKIWPVISLGLSVHF